MPGRCFSLLVSQSISAVSDFEKEKGHCASDQHAETARPAPGKIAGGRR